MARFKVEFERISRDRFVPAQEFEARTADELAYQVYKFADKRTASRDIEVIVDLEAGTGMIYAGMHNAGTFTVQELAA